MNQRPEFGTGNARPGPDKPRVFYLGFVIGAVLVIPLWLGLRWLFS